MKPVQIAKDIYDVGVTDWNIRDFHGYSTYMGTSYNAYLILDEKKVLIDTVKKEFSDQLIHNITRIIDPRQIDCVISNHTELDHSGGIARIMHEIGENKPLYCSKMGKKNLSLHWPHKYNYQPVENGQELSLGRRTLSFLEARMLHWPDSMFTYVKEDKILFSSDAFGQHYAGQENFDDQVGDAIMPHAQKYFANILLPYSSHVLKLLETVSNLKLELDMICPDHGIIWRRHPEKILDAYVRWSRQIPQKKAVIIYDSMWESTGKMAEMIGAGLDSEDIEIKPMRLRKWHRSDIMTEVLDAGAILVGSPTLNNGFFPTIGDFLTYLKGLKPKNKIGAAFGSYGWSGEAVPLIQAMMETMKFKPLSAGLKIQYVPDNEGMKACFEFGQKIGRAMKEK
ncbi:MAG: FprA family A-type flavoprotein [Desulfobacterales bacterium]|nr:FprA family A-type flavoprotein [Desulfobacterales bacterium]